MQGYHVSYNSHIPDDRLNSIFFQQKSQDLKKGKWDEKKLLFCLIRILLVKVYSTLYSAVKNMVWYQITVWMCNKIIV